MHEILTLENIRQIVDRDGLEHTTKKTIRESLESKYNLEKGHLKEYKHILSELVDKIVLESDTGKNTDKNDKKNDDDSTGKPPKLFSCITRSGTDCPKNIKNLQAKSGMSRAVFLNSGKRIKIDVDGNTLSGDPREFSSGNLGWYLTGKIEVLVHDKPVWAQVGMNITVPGSQSWE